jgi:hypothetical protein
MIIGLLGFAGSGKGTVGNILSNEFGFFPDSFAAPVKDAVAAIFGWNRELLEGDSPESRLWRETLDPWWEKRVEGMTPRYALQLMGTEAGRNIFDPDIWLYSLERRMLQGNNYVITDVRFPNEMKFLRDLGGKIVRVKRGPEPEWFNYAAEWNLSKPKNPQVMDKFPDIHYSEWAWIGHPVDYTIENEGSFEDLRKEVYNYVGELK